MQTLQTPPEFGQTEVVGGGLYRELLGAEFDQLHPGVQRSLCAPLSARGTARVGWGDSRMARILRMPRPGEEIPVSLEVTSTAKGQRWRRQFGEDLFLTRQRVCKGLLIEQVGVAATVLRVEREEDSLRFSSVAGHMLGICAPLTFAPQVDALLCGLDDNRWHVHVVITTCRRLICQYEAQIEAV